MEGEFEMSQWCSGANICGCLSLLCCLPYLTLFVAGGRLHFPDWMAPIAIWSIFASPFAGVVLALIAFTANRWWLVPAATWLALIEYGWWDLSRHPFYI
jgi:protein-S-isoprenylcysteine O-methyltransferase Ste14